MSSVLESAFDLGYLGDSALSMLAQLSPSIPWANKFNEEYKGLPFGTYLHATRPRRKRRLTHPLASSLGSLWPQLPLLSSSPLEQHTFDQSGSAFIFKLPLDIRIIIYEMVLGGMVFHLQAQNKDSRILLWICDQPDRINDLSHQCRQLSPQRPSSAPREHSTEATGLLTLLVTCRRIYSEAIEILYSSNVFEFTQNFAAFRFLKMMIPPTRLRSIRHLRLKMRVPHHPTVNSRSRRDWRDLFHFFAHEMTGLQTLYLKMLPLEPVQARIRETADTDQEAIGWVRPMMQMTVDVNRSRYCKIEVGTASAMHDLGCILKDTTISESDQERVLDVASVMVHRRIRLALDEG